MFGNTKNTEDTKTSSSPAAGSNTLNALAKGTVVEGNIRCESDLRIDGTIKGKLICQSKVILGPTGVVEGEIRCQNAVLEGRFKGILQVADTLNVRETADVEGEISVQKLQVVAGAKFNVTCKMESGAAANGSVKNFDAKTSSNASTTTTSAVAGGKEESRN